MHVNCILKNQSKVLKLSFYLDFKTKTNAAQTMEAVLTYAPTHRAPTVAPVDQVSHRLPMESLAQVMFSR